MKRHAALLLLFAFVFAVMIASVPANAQTTIYACITKSTGQVRIVSTAGQCKSNEASISWNAIGPQGPVGPVGPAGPTGPQGPEGPPPAPEPSNNQTRLLFPFVTNQAGFDTGLSIANTTLDPFGTTSSSGTCTLNFYGASAPASISSGNVAAGTLYTALTSTIAPNFQGYVIAVCNFPLAHGFYFVSDLGARNLAMGGNAIVLPSTRTDAVVESRGQ